MAELTNGQKAVGKSFNPGQLPVVDQLKSLFAEAFDIVEATTDLADPVQRKLRDAALAEIISAQMWSVKVATWGLK